ncbi:MAG: hypothetical protein AB2693_31795, partial [Candidatus Thiodiazotropha sp.]
NQGKVDHKFAVSVPLLFPSPLYPFFTCQIKKIGNDLESHISLSIATGKETEREREREIDTH